MLINFRVQNFLSFNDLTEFSMNTSKRFTRHPSHVYHNEKFSLLKGAILYGANASGKSNLVEAIRFSKYFIIKGFIDTPNDFFYGVSNKWSRISKNNKDRFTSFEYDLLIENEIYSYGFQVSLNQEVVTNEWLYRIKDSDEEVIFTREYDSDKETYINNYDKNELKDILIKEKLTEDTKLRVKVYLEDLDNNRDQLFLSNLYSNKKNLNNENSISIKIFEWFDDKLEVLSPTSSVRGSLSIFNDSQLEKLKSVLKAFGTGITDVKLKEVKSDEVMHELPKKLYEKIVEDFVKGGASKAQLRTPQNIYEFSKKESDEVVIKKIQFIHEGNHTTSYSLGEESDGTVRLIDIYTILLSDNERTFVIDEIDRSLHPNLTFQFVENFMKSNEPKKERQLIVTTHEDHLLDLDLIRQDEIWFVDKDKQGNSSLYPLTDYKERFDKRIQKSYLEGRYGAIPNLNNILGV